MKILICILALFVTASSVQARTWRVNLAGTGDAPDIYAAMDSAQAFDEVLLEPGEYVLHDAPPQRLGPGLLVPKDVLLRGEAGPGLTRIVLFEADAPGAVSLQIGAGISGIHIRSSAHTALNIPSGSATNCIVEATAANVTLVQSGYDVPYFYNCLFVGGEIVTPAYFWQCIVTSYLGSYAVGSAFYMCDVTGYVDPGIDVPAANLNFSADPQFCGIPGSGNFYLKSTSPCLPENGPFGPPGFLVGPLAQGCGTVEVQQSTWGSVKALYR